MSGALPRYCNAPPVQGNTEQPLLLSATLSAYAAEESPISNAERIANLEVIFIFFPPETTLAGVLRCSTSFGSLRRKSPRTGVECYSTSVSLRAMDGETLRTEILLILVCARRLHFGGGTGETGVLVPVGGSSFLHHALAALVSNRCKTHIISYLLGSK